MYIYDKLLEICVSTGDTSAPNPWPSWNLVWLTGWFGEDISTFRCLATYNWRAPPLDASRYGYSLPQMQAHHKC